MVIFGRTEDAELWTAVDTETGQETSCRSFDELKRLISTWLSMKNSDIRHAYQTKQTARA